MVNIKDVAKKANVSIATVSHVLNNTKFVREEARQRVLGAVEETGYVRNSIARSLKLKETKTIGMVITYIDNPVYSGLFKSIEEKAELKGYSVMVTTSNDNTDIEVKQIQSLLSKKVDGLIIVPSKNSKIHEKKIIPKNFPVVTINRRIEGFECNHIGIENENAAFEVTSHLIKEHNKKHIGIVVGEKSNELSKQRRNGFLKALKQNNLDYNPGWDINGESNFKGGARAAKKLLTMKEPPESVFIAGTTMMLGFMFQIKNMDIKSPDEISTVGFSDSSMSILVHPTLSCVAQPIEKMAESGLELLTDHIENNHSNNIDFILPCTIYYRESCGCNWEYENFLSQSNDNMLNF